MNRFHVHLNVADLAASVRFYSALFAAEREATTYNAGEAACATDGAACTPDRSAMKPKVDKGAPCCAPASGCC